jgi:excisionase family DNA binding protein
MSETTGTVATDTALRALVSSDGDLVTSEEAADALGYTVQHVRRLARAGRLQGRKLGRDWLILHESVARFLAERASRPLPFELAEAEGETP